VLLFTDLANPTSNALYQRIGYEAVSDFLVLEFGAAAAAPGPLAAPCARGTRAARADR
jgi:hypothetical protein